MARLTAKEVQGLRTAGKFSDGDGLLLHVKTADQRYWTFRYERDGCQRTMTFGNASKVTLAAARAKAAAARDSLRQGVDPLDAKRAAREQARAARQAAAAVVTFADAAQHYIAAHRSAWRGRSEQHWTGSLANHVLPVIGSRPVDRIGIDDVLKVLRPIWTAKPETASIVRGRLQLVLDAAKARGWRTGENPAAWRGNLQFTLPATGKLRAVQHRPALDWASTPGLMARLADDRSMASMCLRLLILTACRSGEARGCRWSEIGLDAAVWTIPAARTKTAKQHRVPLSDAALAILHDLAALRTEAPLVFVGRYRGHGLGGKALTAALRKAGYETASVHGFRSSFADWAADHGQASDVVESALAHTVGSAVRRAYARTDLLEQRRRLMDAWARFLTAPAAEVIPLLAAG
jgi:integrase